jgi:hypothetical protein
MTGQFEANLASTGIQALSPFVLHSVYMAAVILTSGLGNTDELNREQAISSLKAVLHCVSRRWQIGSMR